MVSIYSLSSRNQTAEVTYYFVSSKLPYIFLPTTKKDVSVVALLSSCRIWIWVIHRLTQTDWHRLHRYIEIPTSSFWPLHTHTEHASKWFRVRLWMLSVVLVVAEPVFDWPSSKATRAYQFRTVSALLKRPAYSKQSEPMSAVGYILGNYG